MEVAKGKQQNHFVLVHGACHGAWSWYKVKPLLESAGHRVTAIDLSASGTNMKSLDELRTFSDYTEPLIELIAAIPPEEKVILVGHSYGGINMALAMDLYPEKISVAIYLAALMPDTIHAPSYVLDKYLEWLPEGHLLDTEFLPYGSPKEESRKAIFFGPQYLSSKLYEQCTNEVCLLSSLKHPIHDSIWISPVVSNFEGFPMKSSTKTTTLVKIWENMKGIKGEQLCFFQSLLQMLTESFICFTRQDLELAKMLIRPMSLFIDDLSKAKPFSAEGFGSVKRVYITVNEDRAVPIDFQHWMVESIGVTEVKEINDADHTAMLSQPHRICQCFLEIADKYC